MAANHSPRKVMLVYPLISDRNVSQDQWWNKASRPRLRQVHTRMAGAYFHRNISRTKAEELLLAAREDGSFLVRDSETLTGAYVLCLLHQSRVHQYRVIPGEDGKLSVQSEGGTLEPRYNNLNELIADYINKQDKNGLAMALKFPVSPERLEPDSDDDDEQLSPAVPKVIRKPSYVNLCAVSENGEQNNDPVSKLQSELKKNLCKMDLSQFNEEFQLMLQSYIDNGIPNDLAAVNKGETNLTDYQRMVEAVSEPLRREVLNFMGRLSAIHSMLEIPDLLDPQQQLVQPEQGTGMPILLQNMTECRNNVMSVESKVQETLRCFTVSHYDYVDLDITHSGFPNNTTPLLSTLGKQPIPRLEFDVKVPKHQAKFSCKMTLTLDVSSGKLFAVKPSKDVLDASNIISQDRIVQLVKSTQDNCKLDLIYDVKKKMTFLFATPYIRENFCHSIINMKQMHSDDVDVDQISIFIGSWNMGDRQATSSILPWLKCSGCGKSVDSHYHSYMPHDMYVIGTQESAMTEKDWVQYLKKQIKTAFNGIEMNVVEVCTLWGIRLVILVRKEHSRNISRVQRSTVRTGIANALGNKGGVGISFYFRGTSFCFVNTHLTSGDEKNDRRNQNFRDILKGLSLGQKHLGVSDITNQFHHLFWLGDLNYRVEEEIHTLLEKLERDDIQSLLDKDQLRKSQKEGKGFTGFNEAEILFKPTYRLPRSERKWSYDWKKVKKTGVRINSPSWCDRILWRSYPKTYIHNNAYGCADSVLGSDHRPVFGSFNTGIASDFVMNRDSIAEENPTKIVFYKMKAELKTFCKQTFQLEFHSTCLPEVIQSKPCSKFGESQFGFACPQWSKNELSMMKPLFGDQDFLVDQHILICVRSKCGDNESYGECVIALKDKFHSAPICFEADLFHLGEPTGKLEGKMHIVSGSADLCYKNSLKTYELISLDTEYQDPELLLPKVPKHANEDDSVYAQVDEVPSSPVPAAGEDLKTPCPNSGRPPAVIPRNPQPERPTFVTSRPKEKLPSSQPPSYPPPPPPKKKGHTLNISQENFKRYDYLRRPESVCEWLRGIDLQEYVEIFLKNGFESMDFVKNLKTEDLKAIGICNPIHRGRILDSLMQIESYC